MKKFNRIPLLVTTMVIGAAMVMSSCSKEEAIASSPADEKLAEANVSGVTSCGCLVNPADTIFPAEIEMLRFMREEEKLARDVYATLSAQHSIPIFKNISKSEQFHMDQVLCLLQHYGIGDPASPEVGVFTNPDLQALYDNLVQQGNVSLNEALTVGATIEDIDIKDLEELVSQTSNEAIINTFGHLTCGSRNHIRSFTAILSARGETYVPQYISQEEYDEIVAEGHEFCGCTNQ